MASTNTALQLPFQLDQQLGQGDRPHLEVLQSTSDVSQAVPVWSYVTSQAKSFSVSRGRESELVEMDAGTARITFDNRDRAFDPVHNTGIRPLNQYWIRVKYSGMTHDLFKGYAERYDQRWPSPVGDAETDVQLVDEFKVLAASRVPATSPPRGSYSELVSAHATPAGYWPMNDPPALGAQTAYLPPPPGPPPRGINNQQSGAIGDDWGWVRGPWAL
jgi:hypothetical protein